MELKGFITATLTDLEGRLAGALDGLSAEELAWRPSSECNSIGFILWHIIRVEDFQIQRFIQQQPELYEAEGWQQKLGTPPRESGYQYTAEQLEKFPVPPLSELLEYGKAARQKTLEFVEKLPVEKLDEKPRPDRSELSIGDVLRRILTELTLHIGQIAYLRGLQRGLNQ